MLCENARRGQIRTHVDSYRMLFPTNRKNIVTTVRSFPQFPEERPGPFQKPKNRGLLSPFDGRFSECLGVSHSRYRRCDRMEMTAGRSLPRIAVTLPRGEQQIKMERKNLMAGTQLTGTQITLTREEKDYLGRILQNAMGETRVEVHRTHSPRFREQVLDEEKLVRGLLSKLEQSL